MSKQTTFISEISLDVRTGLGHLASRVRGFVTPAITKINRALSTPVPSLYIDDSSIKLTVTRAGVVEKWAVEPLEPGLVSNNSISDSTAVSLKIRELFDKQMLKPGKTVVGLSGLHAITRIFTMPAVPAKFMEEAVYNEAERELPVSVHSVYLAWKVISNSSGEVQVFLIAYAREVLDSIVSALQGAGIKTPVLELAPLALTHAVRAGTSAVFDVRQGEMDIVIVTDNIPRLSRSVPLPREMPLEENLPIIMEELERTILYYKGSESIENIPIFGFGQLQPEMYQYISDALGSGVSSPAPPLSYPDDFLSVENAVNLGLTAGKLKLAKYGYVPGINIDLLPAIYRKKSPLPYIVAASGAVMALAVLSFSIVQLVNVSASVNEYDTELTSAQELLNQKQRQFLDEKRVLADLEAQASQAEQEWTTLSASQNTLNQNRTEVNNNLIAALKFLPEKISLTNVGYGSSLSLAGAANSKATVLAYVVSLEEDQFFKSIVLTINDPTDSTSQQGVTFVMNLEGGG